MSGSDPRRPVAPGGLLTLFAGLYATQGLVGGLAHEALPVLLRARGVALDTIGLLSLLFLPSALKFLWAPAVDRRCAAGPTQRLHWARRLQLVLVAAALPLAWLAPGSAGGAGAAALAAVLLLLALVSVTQDIATDGMAVQTLEPGQRGLGNMLQIGGSYLGYILGGGLLVLMVQHLGWQAGLLYFCALLAMCTLPALWLGDRRLRPSQAAAAQAPTAAPRLSRAWRRPQLRWGMATVIAFQAPVRWFTGVMLPHLVDRGFAAGEAGLLSGAGMALAGITGALLGGLLLRRFGRTGLMRACQALYLALLLAYLLTEATAWQPAAVLAALFLAFCTAMALGFVVLYTVMMDWASPAQAGTDYSLLQCTDAFCALVFGLGAATATHHLGYGASFAVAAALALAGLLLAPRLHARARAAASPTDPAPPP